MGFNVSLAGFPNVEEIVSAMIRSEDAQIMAMMSFLKNSKIDKALENRDWAAFARAYNGPTFAKNQYDAKLAGAHKRFSAAGLPDLDARAVQLLLLFHGFDPGAIDGIVGAKTKSAIAVFHEKLQLPVPRSLDHPALKQILTEKLPPAAEG